jgi:hypothetical protein
MRPAFLPVFFASHSYTEKDNYFFEDNMRLLNMNQLKHLRYSLLRDMHCIGKGTFASVFEASPDAASVTKITNDTLAYYFQADGLWLNVRGKVESHFPRLIESHGEVGQSRGANAYGLVLERLQPLSTKANRKIVNAWRKSWSDFRETFPPKERGHEASSRFCENLAEVDGPYQHVFAALAYFFMNYGGALDLKTSNFMERPGTNDLVFNDVVFDMKHFNSMSFVH